MKINVRTAAIAGLVSIGLFTAGQAEAASLTCDTAKNVQVKTYKTYYQVKWPAALNASAPAQTVKAQPTAPAEAKPQQTPVQEAPKQEQAKPAAQPSSSESVNAFEQEVAKLVNEERAKAGLKALTLDTELSKVARAKSQDMKDKSYFSHQSPTYGSPFDMMKKFGITYKAAGENIAKGQKTPEEVMEAWMNSDGHRKNILSADFTHIGVGYVDGHWTQMFIGK
ncbi:CAP domain-containing protein [Domibacillus robiginosus]|uniref:CAP domain-containing protein n=1 Tax=Domibacillus robiginosus TaxID=1071054 RepID=UPI00067C86EC|nr:CAP domain-containing protein [Domibacillus robiginosus]